jgi:hypothetical protein
MLSSTVDTQKCSMPTDISTSPETHDEDPPASSPPNTFPKASSPMTSKVIKLNHNVRSMPSGPEPRASTWLTNLSMTPAMIYSWSLSDRSEKAFDSYFRITACLAGSLFTHDRVSLVCKVPSIVKAALDEGTASFPLLIYVLPKLCTAKGKLIRSSSNHRTFSRLAMRPVDHFLNAILSV